MLTLWRPYADWFRTATALDRIFDWGDDHLEASGLTPAVDIDEEAERFVLRADLPGFEEKDLDVRVHDGVLLLSGKREARRDEGTYRERRHGSFCRQFQLGGSVDETKIEANYKNGVLTVVLPKKEEVKPRQIPVRAS